MINADIGEHELPRLVIGVTVGPWSSGGLGSWPSRTPEPQQVKEVMADREILSLSERDLVQLISEAFDRIGNTRWLSESPLAACSLTAAAVVPDDMPQDQLDLGRAVRAVLIWTLNRLAPTPHAYPLGEPRPASDASWRQPRWLMYNVLRHRYLDPAEHPDLDGNAGAVEHILRLTGIATRHRLNALRLRALRRAAGFVRQALLEQTGQAEVQRAAMDEFCQPLGQRPASRSLLEMAGVFRGEFPRALLAEMTAREGIQDIDSHIAFLLSRRMLAVGDGSGSLRVPVRLRQFMTDSADPLAARWHSQAADHYSPLDAPSHAAWHLFHAGRHSEFLVAVLSTINKADEAQSREWLDLLERMPAAGLSPIDTERSAMARGFLCLVLRDQARLAKVCREMLNLNGSGEFQAKAYILLGIGLENDPANSVSLLDRAAQCVPAGTTLWLAAMIRKATLLTAYRSPMDAKACLDCVQRHYDGSQPQVNSSLELALAQCHIHLGQPQTALPLAQSALTELLIEKSSYYIVHAKTVISQCYRNLGNTGDALAYAEDALTQIRELKGPGLTRALLTAAEAFLAAGEPRQAQILLREGLDDAKDSGSPLPMFELHLASAAAWSASGDWDAAARHANAAKKLAVRIGFGGLEAAWNQRIASIPPLREALAATGTGAVEALVFDLIGRDGAVAARELARASGISSATARHALSQLCAAGKLVRDGAGRSTRYIAPEGTAEVSGPVTAAFSGLDAEAMKLIRRAGRVSTRDLQELLGIPRSTAQHLIARLAARGAVTAQGKGRATVYCPVPDYNVR